MNLRINSFYYEALMKNKIFPPCTIAFQPSPNLMMSQHQTDTIVYLRRTQAKEELNTLSVMSSAEGTECKHWADPVAQALKVYYHQLDASWFNFHEVLEALVTLTECL